KRDREKGEREPTPCTRCGYVKQAHVCPTCGYKPERAEMLESTDGDLVEMKSSQKRKFTTEQKRDIYAQFLGHAKKQGYSDGWAYHKCREYCGTAPRDTKAVRPKDPSIELAGWIRHAQ